MRLAALAALCFWVTAAGASSLPARERGRTDHGRRALPHQQIDKRCPKFAHVPFANGGAGHIFSDIVLGMELATRTNATFVLEDMDDPARPVGRHGTYPGLLAFLNLDGTEMRVRDVQALYAPRVVNASWHNATRVIGCNILIRVLDTSCDVPASSTRLADTGLDDSCHTVLGDLYNKYKHVFRAKYMANVALHRRAYGRLFSRASVNVAWHIRTGDIKLHQGDAEYFGNTRAALDAAAHAVGMPSAHYVFAERDLRGQPGYGFLARLDNVTFVGNATLLETIHHMAHADVVVETGSSMTAIAHTIAEGPLFVYGCAKEGCDVRIYDVDGLFKVDARGRLLASDAELWSALQVRMLSRARAQLL
jgi:hypothetical protein